MENGAALHEDAPALDLAACGARVRQGKLALPRPPGARIVTRLAPTTLPRSSEVHIGADLGARSTAARPRGNSGGYTHDSPCSAPTRRSLERARTLLKARGLAAWSPWREGFGPGRSRGADEVGFWIASTRLEAVHP